MRIKTKIIAILFPILATQAVGFYLPSSLLYERYHKEQIHRHMSDFVSNITSAFDNQLRKVKADTLLFSKTHALKRYVGIEDLNIRFQVMHQTLLSEFAGFQKAKPEYFDISLVMPDGFEEVRQVSTSAKDLTDQEIDTFYLRSFSDSNKNFSMVSGINPDDQQWSLIAGRRLYVESTVDNVDLKEKFAGWLIVKTDFEFFKSLIKGSRFSEQGHIIIFHDDGRIVWQSDDDSALAKKHLQHIQEGPNLTSEEQLKNNTYGPAVFFSNREADILISTKQPLSYGLNIAAAWPGSILTSIIQQAATISMQLSALVIAVSLIVFFFALNKILIQPIYELVSLSEKLGKGEALAEKHFAKDELGSLKEALYSMGKRLIEQKESLHNIAFHDSLTKLPNRRRFIDQLESHFSADLPALSNSALLFIDLDGFKQVNDRYGHYAGDAVLKEVSMRLKQVLRTDDVVEESHNHELARLGGDEFTVLLRDIQKPEAINIVVRRILDCLSKPYIHDGHELYLSASIGIAISDGDNQCAVDLLKNADAAMYHAKKQGKNTFHYFDRTIAEQLYQKLELKNRLNKAITNSEISLAYQPQVSTKTGKLIGIEALARWHIPEMGWIRPDIFIPIAEDAGLICQLGRWIMLEACRQNREWQKQGLPVVPVSINASNLQFSQGDMLNTVINCLAESNLPPQLMKLEVTESSIMQGESSIEQIKRIREIGVKVSLDDFGTGYSSLSALHGLPIDQLKIDKSFISGLQSGEDGKAIVSAIIAMAKQLKLEVVAEGVETSFELEFIKKHHADVVQGYYYSKPLRAEKFRQTYLLSAKGFGVQA